MAFTDLMFDDDDNSSFYVPEEEPQDKGNVVDNIVEGTDLPLPESFLDPLNVRPPDEPRLNSEEEEEVREELQQNGEGVPTITEQTMYDVEVEPDEEAINHTMMYIDGVMKVVETVKEAVHSFGSIVSEKVREYKNTAKFEKPSFSKPKTAQSALMPQIFMGVGISLGAAIYFGVEANSYFIAKNGNVPNALNCAFAWIADPPPVVMSPFYMDIFFTAFFVVLLVMAVIIFFIWDSSAGKKRRREGHEHGNARLATKSDFSKYKKRFMD